LNNNHDATQVWVSWGKALASQLIVWHHLLIYGPLAPAADVAWPDLADFLQQDARLAVQVFLVIGGYLAARSLWPTPGSARLTLHDWPARTLARYRRLLPMLLLALLAAVLAAAFARSGMSDPDTPAAPTWPQLLAHLLMLQDIVDQPALSAGIWYVAIDLQLFGLLAALAALAHGSTRRAQTGTTPAAIAVLLLVGTKLASVAWFNLEDDGDMWAPYFFGAYGLGVLAAWGARSGQRAGTTALLASLVLLALLLEWRSRLALAGLVAVLLLWQPWGAELARSRLDALMQWLARISYAVFLLHYPVSLAVSTVVMWAAPSTPAAHVAGLVLTWLLSLAAGWLATRWLEARPAGMRGAAPA